MIHLQWHLHIAYFTQYLEDQDVKGGNVYKYFYKTLKSGPEEKRRYHPLHWSQSHRTVWPAQSLRLLVFSTFHLGQLGSSLWVEVLEQKEH